MLKNHLVQVAVKYSHCKPWLVFFETCIFCSFSTLLLGVLETHMFSTYVGRIIILASHETQNWLCIVEELMPMLDLRVLRFAWGNTKHILLFRTSAVMTQKAFPCCRNKG